MEKTDMNTIKKEVAVVTGAGGTLCSALAIELGQKGYDVVLMGRSMDKLLKTEQTIKAAGGNAFPWPAMCAIWRRSGRRMI